VIRMRRWLLLLAAVVVGLGIGSTRTYLEKNSGTDRFFSEDFWSQARATEANRQQLKKTSGELLPKVEVEGGEVYDFGSMERFSKMKRTFRLKNVGKGDLRLTPRRNTCKCTVSEITNKYAKPGEAVTFTVEWTGQTMMDSPDFAQTVEVGTNDPDKPVVRVRIKGYVTETLRAVPSELVVGMVSSNTGSEARFHLFGFRNDHIDILDTTWEDKFTAQFFDVSYEPLPKEEVEKEKGASCGLLAKVTVKPGLPLGPINQTIHVKALVDKEATLHIPVKGRALSDIRIASSPVFSADLNLLKFGTLKRTEAAKAVLQLYVTGEHRHETSLSIGEVDPADYLKVSIGPPKELNNGKTVQYLVTIEVPPGLEPINRMGGEKAALGRVVLETSHPQTKQVPIRVKFSVQ
jgi:hypothetical protein